MKELIHGIAMFAVLVGGGIGVLSICFGLIFLPLSLLDDDVAETALVFGLIVIGCAMLAGIGGLIAWGTC